MSLESLSHGNHIGYGPLPIPVSKDIEISEALEAWAALDQTARNAAAGELSTEACVSMLECYSWRMASLAVRTGDQKFIFLGLLALGVFGWLPPWGIRVEFVTLHYDASNRIGVSTECIFEKAAALLSSKVASDLRSYLKRPPHLKTLECMFFHTAMDSGGFRYEKDGPLSQRRRSRDYN